jgi:hypothetical protein
MQGGDGMTFLPWWVYLCIVGIIFSAYMAYKTAKKDKEIEEIFIEREGNVYIERMKKEKEKRAKEKMTSAN